MFVRYLFWKHYIVTELIFLVENLIHLIFIYFSMELFSMFAVDYRKHAEKASIFQLFGV